MGNGVATAACGSAVCRSGAVAWAGVMQPGLLMAAAAAVPCVDAGSDDDRWTRAVFRLHATIFQVRAASASCCQPARLAVAMPAVASLRPPCALQHAAATQRRRACAIALQPARSHRCRGGGRLAGLLHCTTTCTRLPACCTARLQVPACLPAALQGYRDWCQHVDLPECIKELTLEELRKGGEVVVRRLLLLLPPPSLLLLLLLLGAERVAISALEWPLMCCEHGTLCRRLHSKPCMLLCMARLQRVPPDTHLRSPACASLPHALPPSPHLRSGSCCWRSWPSTSSCTRRGPTCGTRPRQEEAGGHEGGTLRGSLVCERQWVLAGGRMWPHC